MTKIKINNYIYIVIFFIPIAIFLSSTLEANSKPTLEVVTHAGAGGGTDVNSRMMMLRSRRVLRQDMVIVNKRGGGGAAAMNYFMTRPADGNTILTFTVGHAITMAMGNTNLKIEDIAPIARGTNDPQILMVNCKKSPYKTPESFVSGVRNGDKITYGGTHTGTIDHITAFLWSNKNNQKMPRYIPFKGGGELATQVVAGSVDVGILNLSEAGAPIDAGDLCPLVILGDNAMDPIPKAKTAKSLGVDLVLSTFRGFVTHASVNPARVAKMEKGLAEAMKHSIYQAYLANSGLDNTSPQASDPWGKQIKSMVNDFRFALYEMGLSNTFYPKTKKYLQPKSIVRSAELDTSKREAELEKQKRINLEHKLAVLEKQQREAQKSKPKIVVATKPKSDFPLKPIALNFRLSLVKQDDIAVIIGNANYEKQGKDIPNVNPAYADAEGIKQYFMQAKGIKEGNIIYLKDATGSQLASVFGNEKSYKGKLFNYIKPKKSNVYIYYAGHGAPGEGGDAYLVPSDTDSQTIQFTGFQLSTLYSNLSKLPAKSVTVILEACFSGGSQSGSLISKASPIIITPKKTMIPNNVKVIAAGSERQMASWEQDSSHSLFTKYFLKAMSGEGDSNKDGKVSDVELKEYLSDTMTYYARRYYGRDQKVQIHNGG